MAHIHMLNTVDERQPPDPPDIVERLRHMAKLLGYDLPDLLGEAADEIERLRKLLDGRDDFIVSKGLWMDFTGQLEP